MHSRSSLKNNNVPNSVTKKYNNINPGCPNVIRVRIAAQGRLINKNPSTNTRTLNQVSSGSPLKKLYKALSTLYKSTP